MQSESIAAVAGGAGRAAASLHQQAQSDNGQFHFHRRVLCCGIAEASAVLSIPFVVVCLTYVLL
ncbi:MAG: hypothetical protein M0C28_26160, partial [Candidatus Moduliflexus flocculans]|nr:hypothetical protein [Candidatus Moduliflexus flocculans]